MTRVRLNNRRPVLNLIVEEVGFNLNWLEKTETPLTSSVYLYKNLKRPDVSELFNAMDKELLLHPNYTLQTPLVKLL